jgi:chromosome segregation ATPase
MESTPQGIEGCYQLKAALLKELLDCLSLEKDNLIDLNLENLWPLMEKKQAVLRDIEGAEERIKAVMERDRSGERVPSKVREALTALSRKINHLQDEIRARVRENVSFIQETLQFFDELITLFISAGQPEQAYHPARKNQKEPTTLLYHREV